MRQRQSGFTLLEIMLVLSLMGVLLTLVGSALLGANRAVLKAQRYTASLDETRAAQGFLRRAIAQALPLENAHAGSNAIFVGASDRLQFVATLPGALGGGLQLHRLALDERDGQRHLQVAFEQLQPDATSRPWGEPQVLLHDVKTLKFSYRGLTPKGEPTDWLNEWPWPERLPRAVRIDVQVDGPVPWLREVVALRLDLSGGVVGQ